VYSPALFAPREVCAGASAPVNSDPNYRLIRDASPAESFVVENVTLAGDVGRFTLRKGTLTFTAPVLGRTPFAVFVVDGEFQLQPLLPLERNYLRSLTDKEAVTETFERTVFAFTGGSLRLPSASKSHCLRLTTASPPPPPREKQPLKPLWHRRQPELIHWLTT
jgi:hypothetical protein